MSGNEHQTERFWTISLALLTLTICLGSLGAPLLEPTEARYALIAAEMLERNTWFVPYLNHEPYLDKPPLLYWALMFSYSLFGISDAAARVVPTLCSLGTVMIAWSWLRLTSGARAALLATTVFVLSPRAMYYMQMVAMDALIGLAAIATISSLHMALGRDRIVSRWLIPATLATLTGVMAKGPVILIVTLVPAGLALLVTQHHKRLPWLGAWLTASILGSSICFIGLDQASPGFSHHFLFRHNIQRFSTPFDHEGPWWYHLPGTILGALPWTLLIPIIWWQSRRNVLGSERSTAPAWVAFSFVIGLLFFSVAGSKRPSYCTAFLPQGCLALGLFLDRLLPNGWSNLSQRHFVGANGLAWFGCASLISLPVIGFLMGWCSVVWIPIVGTTGLAGCLATWHLGNRWDMALAMTGTAIVFGQTVLLTGHHEQYSPRKAIAWLAQHRPGTRFVCYPHPFESMGFYVSNNDLTLFEIGKEAELALYMEQNPNAVLVAKGNKLPSTLIHAFKGTLEQATPFKSTPWIMKQAEPGHP